MKRDNQPIYYGWYIVAALAITTTMSYGTLYYSYQVLLKPMESDTGWTLSQLSGAFSLALLTSGFVTLAIGNWLDRYGGRLLMTLGSTLATLLLITWAFVQSLTMLYVVWLLLGFAMAMVFYDPAFVVVVNWFKEKRGLALAIVTFVGGLASTIYFPLVDYLLQTMSWRNAVFCLGIGFGVVTIPLHALILRHRPQNLGLRIDGHQRTSSEDINDDSLEGISARDALHSRVFWLLVFGFGLASFTAVGMRFHFVYYLDFIGYDSTLAAWLAGTIGTMQVLGRVMFAPVERHFSSRILAAGIMFLLALSLGILLISQSLLFIGLFVIVYGAAVGAVTLVRPMLLSDMYGVAEYGRINSVIAFTNIFVITAAPIGASLLFEGFGSYQPVILIFLLVGLAAAGVILQIPSEKRKVATLGNN